MTGSNANEEIFAELLGDIDMCDPLVDLDCIELFGVGFTVSYLYYLGGFFGGIFGTLFLLLNYNLFKMFGWDEDIQVIIRD